MALNRRAFLQVSAAALAPWTVTRVAAAQTVASRDSAFDPWIEVRPDHLAHNVAEVSRLAGGRPIMAVIKNNGYGLGLLQVARVFASLKEVRGLAVVKLNEAITLRDAGITSPILMMGPCDERDLQELHARDIMPMVYTPIGDTLARIAARSGKSVRLHVKIDTGLGRVGVPHRDAAELVRDLASRPGVIVDGVMTTLTEDATFDQEQLRRFESITADLSRGGATIGRRHVASSYTMFQHGNAWLDMVRPGMALYGVYPEPAFRTSPLVNLRPAMAFKVRVAFGKLLRAGDSAGYNRAYVAKADTWIATLPVGHADGWPRATAKGAKVRIGTKLYPVIASVSASHTLVEIGPEPAMRVGDVATLFDWEDGSRPEDVAAACGASVYDLTMHLGGHLSRKTV